MAQRLATGGGSGGPNLSARIDAKLLRSVKQYALDHDTTIQAVVAAALADYIKKDHPRGA